MKFSDTNIKNKLSVAFLGCIFENNLASYVINNEKNFPQIAANNLGLMFVDGFLYYFNNSLKVFSVLAVSSYPKFNKIYVQPRASESEGYITYINYINIPILKHFFIFVSALLEISKWAVADKFSNKVLVVYSMYASFPALAWFLSKIFNVKVVLIVPDLPEFMRIGVKTSWILNLFLKINQLQLYFFSRNFNGYVFLTKFMADKFNVSTDKYVVVEGCVNLKKDIVNYDVKIIKEPDTRVLLYAGNLNEAYGVRLLLDGFKNLSDPSYRLWLCGNGPMVEEIKNFYTQDSRIKYFGVISNQEVINLSLQATALINPRTSSGEFTKYSFPSKVLEYMNSGKPTIICKLPGIPDEYFDYVYLIKDETIHGLMEVVDYVLSLSDSDLEKRGHDAKEYVKKYKNNISQAGKIAELIRKLYPLI